MKKPFIFAGQTMPSDLRESLDRYAEIGCPVGGFLTACLANDFMEAVGRADKNNVHLLAVIASYIYCELPHRCHGSYEIVKQWIKSKIEAEVKV